MTMMTTLLLKVSSPSSSSSTLLLSALFIVLNILTISSNLVVSSFVVPPAEIRTSNFRSHHFIGNQKDGPSSSFPSTRKHGCRRWNVQHAEEGFTTLFSTMKSSREVKAEDESPSISVTDGTASVCTKDQSSSLLNEEKKKDQTLLPPISQTNDQRKATTNSWKDEIQTKVPTSSEETDTIRMGRTIPQNLPKISDLFRDYSDKANTSDDCSSSQSSTAVHPNKNQMKQHETSKYPKNKTNEQQQQPKPTYHHSNRKPWNADFMTSCRTQDTIKAIASNANVKQIPKMKHGNQNRKSMSYLWTSINILDTLLNTDPTLCNEANVVYALTLSAKLYPPPSSSSLDDTIAAATVHNDERVLRETFRSKLIQTMDIVSSLVSRRQLSGRQLSNVAWALVRHWRNSAFLSEKEEMEHISSSSSLDHPSSSSSTVTTSSTSTKRIAMTDFQREVGKRGLQQAMDLLETISIQLNDILCIKQLKSVELCMIAWAYASIKPRNCPAGWIHPPHETRIPNDILRLNHARQTENGQTNLDELCDDASKIITFERDFSSSSCVDDDDDNVNDDDNDEEVNTSSPDNVCVLFDSICKALTTTTSNKIDATGNTQLLQQCTWKELSNLAWAFANRGHDTITSERFMKRLANEVIMRMELLSSNNNSNTSSSSIDAPLPRDISLIAWSLGVLQADNFRLGDSLVSLIDAISKHILHLPDVDEEQIMNESSRLILNTSSRRPFAEWKCADLVQLAVSLAYARIDYKHLLHSLYDEAFSRLKKGGPKKGEWNHPFQSWELAVLLWVQAKLYLTDKQGDVFRKFSEAVPRHLVQRMKAYTTAKNDAGTATTTTLSLTSPLEGIGIDPQGQANLAWSLTVLKVYTPESTHLLHDIFSAASGGGSSNGAIIQVEHAHQLWQALFILQTDLPKAVEHVPSQFVDFLQEKWKTEKARRKYSSARHRSLSQTLNLMGVAHYNEHEEDIDVAIVLKEESLWTHTAERGDHNNDNNMFSSRKYEDENARYKVAVEFDGPNHFTRGDNPRALGHTVLKYRLLKRQGWTVVRIPYYEFDKIPFWASMERQRYLQRRLKTHASIHFSEVDVSKYKVIVHNRQSRYD